MAEETKWSDLIGIFGPKPPVLPDPTPSVIECIVQVKHDAVHEMVEDDMRSRERIRYENWLTWVKDNL